ncbi:hypothetical protein DOY81_014964, partial [Sarcophaga bullata]
SEPSNRFVVQTINGRERFFYQTTNPPQTAVSIGNMATQQIKYEKLNTYTSHTEIFGNRQEKNQNKSIKH